MPSKKKNPLDTTPELPKEDEKPTAPQLTFTEEEVKMVTEYVNFTFTNAKFDNMTSKQAMRYGQLLSNMHKHVQVCEAHIMELIETSKAGE